ncbi:MAG: hypothetical protein IPJ88_00595 [Myxococcales bacterium]|nr:MAG: hypothetical protein IPJ88_00595 [Myxococcales bacterium]
MNDANHCATTINQSKIAPSRVWLISKKHINHTCFGLVFLCALSAGCHRNPAKQENPPHIDTRQSKVEKQESTSKIIDKGMHEYFDHSTVARDAIVEGELTEATSAFNRLATHTISTKNAPKNWLPFLETWRATARIGSQSTELNQAAEAVGKLGAQCAACHQATRSGPTYDPSGWVEEIVSLKTHMLLLRWATDRMWEGLTEPWDRAWIVGAETLTEAPLELHEFHKFSSNKAAQVKDLAVELKSIATQALKQKSPEGKADAYSRLLVTCSNCHRLLDRER